MTLLSFVGGKQGSKEMEALQRQLGGKIGTLATGRDRQAVLKLGDNVYVALERPNGSMETAAMLDKADIHVVENLADAVNFAGRYRAFGEANGKAKA